jgi:hypothetical protein
LRYTFGAGLLLEDAGPEVLFASQRACSLTVFSETGNALAIAPGPLGAINFQVSIPSLECAGSAQGKAKRAGDSPASIISSRWS